MADAEVIRFPRPPVTPRVDRADGPAVILILPIIRVERIDAGLGSRHRKSIESPDV